MPSSLHTNEGERTTTSPPAHQTLEPIGAALANSGETFKRASGPLPPKNAQAMIQGVADAPVSQQSATTALHAMTPAQNTNSKLIEGK